MPHNEALLVKTKSTRLAGISALAAALLLDQLTKGFVTANAARLAEGISVFSGFNLIFLRNYGISFGLFNQVPSWVLSVVALAISIWIASMMWRAKQTWEAVGCGLIIGGALGNVVDRMRLGAVTDFLDFYVGKYHWPAFNFADIAVVTGLALLVLSPIISRRTHTS